MDAPAHAIEVAALEKRYGHTTAVDGISFSIASGEVFGLLGPNGAGKTTTVEILEGYRRADAGDGAPVAKPRRRASRLGLRARATVAFGCVALALSASLATMAYELTRSYLIKQRQSTSLRQAYVNARLARSVLRTPEPDVPI